MLEWIADLGLTGDLVRSNDAAARRFVLLRGRLRELIPPPRFLVSDVLSIPGRLRLLAEPVIAKRTNPAPESIHDFAVRRIGREAADNLVGPMVTGIFGGDARTLSLAHCFPRMAAMEAEHGGLFRAMRAKSKERRAAGGAKSGSAMGPGGTLTTFRDGIGRLGIAAAERLGGSLRLGRQVERVEPMDEGFLLSFADGETVTSKRVILAAPIHATARMIAGFAPDAAARLAATACCAIAVVCTAYRREEVRHDMNGFGFLIPRSEGKRALGCIWTSSVFPHQAPAGHVLLRTMIGGATDPAAVDLDDAALLDVVAREVHPLLGIDGAPIQSRIFRHRSAIPQYGLNHSDTLAACDAIEAAHPGLAFAGNGYRGVGLNDCVVSARRAVDRVEGAS